MTILSKNAIFRPKTELEAIPRWSVEVSREVDCAYSCNIGGNSGYFLLPIFLGSYLSDQPSSPPLLLSTALHAPPLHAAGIGEYYWTIVEVG